VKVAFVGATRGMGRALARALAERGDALFLLGRDAAGPPGSRPRSTRPITPWVGSTPSW
jgi:NAD(P)-dependent dehydrogenase (short-subunit alcohol dehydrogenase family)